MLFRELSHEQARQTIDSEQAFEAYRAAREELDRRYAGSMSWKSGRGRDYLYRKQRGIWKSLGPRGADTEAVFTRFRTNRESLRDRVAALAARLDAMAPVNRALRLGRLPRLAGRILRSLDQAGLCDTAIVVVGTNALFAYERAAGVQIDTSLLATADVDLLFDARGSLKLLAPDVAASGIMGLLRKLDHSFDVVGSGGYRAVNRDGYMVDLIMPAARDPMMDSAPTRIGFKASDMKVPEIEGLSWLVNSPKLTSVVIDERGYPLEMRVPDPRAFALHKAWLAERVDCDPLKTQQRDQAQAQLTATLLRDRMPQLRFDDPALSALPLTLRQRAETLAPGSVGETSGARRLEPNW